MGFENYKDKQKFYKERAKQEKVIWYSKAPLRLKVKEKGRTYVKPKENENDKNR